MDGTWTIAADLCICHRAKDLEKMINEADPKNKYKK